MLVPSSYDGNNSFAVLRCPLGLHSFWGFYDLVIMANICSEASPGEFVVGSAGRQGPDGLLW